MVSGKIMDPSLEIRKLLPSQVKELVFILETHELWKCLMSIIPKTLNSDFVSDINSHNHAKYHSEHFRLIENASDKTKKPCTEILFDEWGTSGKIRPTLGHLLYLLTKAKLFRAADYVAVNLLNQAPPERPQLGPEAIIRVDLPSSESNNQELNEIEELLNQIDYPSQAVSVIRTNSVEARRPVPAAIPKIVITPEAEPPSPEFTVPLVVRRTYSPDIQNVSDMMKFSNNSSDLSTNESDTNYTSSDYSTEVNSDMQPAFSKLLHSQSPCETPEQKQPSTDMIIFPKSDENILPASLETGECPPLSELLRSNTYSDSESIIPNLSALNIDAESTSLKSEMLPNFDEIMKSDNASAIASHNESTSHPDFDMLMSALGNKNKSKSSWTSLSNESRSRSCTSPLPNLSLNTMLPHFNYAELESATNFFNYQKYSNDNGEGRFLGSGAFGSVFLAIGLLNRPVAVKKLNLENVEVVNIDDTVTKQFRNEVEVLSKYKHENLLSLLGYSCDGCTYCLLYEYIPGGALKDRLQQPLENKLHWEQRIEIAFGTAKAVAYLHTAFSTPLIHRDIKSANILLDCENKPKLCDFGLIKLSPTQHTSTATTVFGTSAYMAPEAFRGDISVKIDTFSFGVVLLELLTSLPPMDENRDGADLVTHVGENCEDEDISPILDKSAGTWQRGDKNCADELFKVALKCLEEKRKRPNMVEVSEMLSLLTRD